MTVTTLPDLTALTDEELAALCAGADEATVNAVIAEGERRDREELRRARTEAARKATREGYERLRAEWYDAAYAQYLQAEAYCGGGSMLSPLGARKTSEPMTLWTGSEDRARRWASEELIEFWDYHNPRLSFGTWLRQRARGLRAQRDDLDAMDESNSGRNGAPSARKATPPAHSIVPPEQAKQHGNEGVKVDAADTGTPAGTRPAWEGSGHYREKAAKRQADLAGLRKERQAAGARATAPGTEVATRPAGAPALVSTPIDGAKVLNQAYGYLGHMAVWPSQAAQITAALYAGVAHAVDDKTKQPVWMYMPRLFYTSKEGGSGKSWMSRLTASLCPSPERLAEMTKASLIDLVAEHHTVVVTELDVFVGTGKRNQWLTGIANVGYEFDGKTSRKQGGKVLKIPLCGPMILDGLDSVIHSTGVDLKTLMSRCIIVHVTRAPEGYRPPRYDREKRAIAQVISDRLARWTAQEVSCGLADREPEVPQHLGNRPFNLWEPAFALAEAAGDAWPEMARYACEHLEQSTGLPGDDEADEARVDSALDTWGATGPAADEGWGNLA